MHITESELLDPEYRLLLESEPVLYVSGRPMNVWQADGKEFHYETAAEVIHMLFKPSLVLVTYIDPVLNNHLSKEFTGEYCVMSGYNPETLDEYRFGVKDDLNFCLQSLSSVVMLD